VLLALVPSLAGGRALTRQALPAQAD